MQKIVFLTTLLMSATLSAAWKNPVDRYAEEYKNHLNSNCPIVKNDIKHFVYFARDRKSIRGHVLLSNPRFLGAQIMYPWSELELEKNQYDFSAIQSDYEYLRRHGKKLFIQLQDATFYSENKGVPDYLFSEEFEGGAVRQFTDEGEPEGWVAKRWNKNVQERFGLLISALGKELDGKIEGINLQETAIGVTQKRVPDFSEKGYVEGLKKNMLSLKTAFPNTTTMQYANFINGEWLPWEDKGYLKSIYQYGEEIGVGLGAPDLMVRRRGQLNHALAMMHEESYSVPIGIAVQDGNYIGQTNSTKVVSERNNMVPMLHSFAKNFLSVDYMFWVNQAPYFEQDVLTCFD